MYFGGKYKPCIGTYAAEWSYGLNWAAEGSKQ
jgi:hypothetical protein